ncbi:hypothetical protein [Nocardia altamirensis]|uniref:hypothetical protein n=1 Tax=Nocardia altamirensis TaxID=472158 RepID=UPI00114CDE29|nr:hypothetical protein [Nocardia altamirensis]
MVAPGTGLTGLGAGPSAPRAYLVLPLVAVDKRDPIALAGEAVHQRGGLGRLAIGVEAADGTPAAGGDVVGVKGLRGYLGESACADDVAGVRVRGEGVLV